MKIFNWNVQKNIELKNNRGISFEEIVFLIENDMLIDVIYNPSNINFSNQEVFVINKENYIYYVPFVENENEIFLKTIIPSRKLTKKYLGK